VVGLTRLQAEQRLVDAGLTAVIETRVQEGATPGRVIQVVPAEGTLVAPGSQVTLVVAVQPPPTSAPPTGEPTTTPPA
jgi:beta-lactam-binding protein with PASTA domain